MCYLSFPVPCGVAYKRLVVSWQLAPMYSYIRHPRHMFTNCPNRELTFYKESLGLETYPKMSLSYKTVSDIKENLRVDSGIEDELSAASQLIRVTPRKSTAGQASPTGRDPTPYANLRHLAGLIRKPSTPQRRASSTGATTSRGYNVGVQSAKSSTSGTRRPLQASLTTRSNPATPHAIRALQQRRATPGRDRRKSGRMLRETPRGALRNLSRSRFAAHCTSNRADSEGH